MSDPGRLAVKPLAVYLQGPTARCCHAGTMHYYGYGAVPCVVDHLKHHEASAALSAYTRGCLGTCAEGSAVLRPFVVSSIMRH